MCRIFLTITGLLLPPSLQHFTWPPTWCQLATMCNHTGIPECGREIGPENYQDLKMFLDECDLYEYNCDNNKEYNKVDEVNCQKNSVTPPSIITALATTTNSCNNTTTIQTSILLTNVVKPAEPQTITSKINCTRYSNPTSPITKLTSANVSTIFVPTTKNCTRNTMQDFPTTITAILSSLSSYTSTSTSTAVNDSKLETADSMKPIITNQSTTSLKCTRHKNSSSPASTEAPLNITTINSSTLSSGISSTTIATTTRVLNKVSNNCTRNSNQNSKTPFFSATISLTSIADSTLRLQTTFTPTSTNLISTPITNVIEPTMPTTKISTIFGSNCTRNKQIEAVTSNCTRSSKSTNSIVSTITSTTPLTTLTSTTIALTTPFSITLDKSEPPIETTLITAHHSCTHDITIPIKPTSPISNSHQLSTTEQATKPMTTKSASKSLDDCNKYPKNCKRPSTWETTAKGETRDFFQILRAKFGNRVKILRATTHWPVRAPYLIWKT